MWKHSVEGFVLCLCVASLEFLSARIPRLPWSVSVIVLNREAGPNEDRFIDRFIQHGYDGYRYADDLKAFLLRGANSALPPA